MGRQSDVQLDPNATLFQFLRRTFNPVYLLIAILFLTSLLSKCHSTVTSATGVTPVGVDFAIAGFLTVALLILFGGALLLQWMYCRALVSSCQIDLRDDGVSMKSGVFGTVSELLLYSRVQDIVISNSVLERLMGLATVFIQNAAGRPIRIWGIDFGTAERLRDLILAQVASPKSGADFAREIDAAQLAPSTGVSDQKASGFGVVVGIAVAIALGATVMIAPWRHHGYSALSVPVSASAPSNVSAPRSSVAPASAPARAAIVHPPTSIAASSVAARPQTGVAQQSVSLLPRSAPSAPATDGYAVACSIHDSTVLDGVIPCSKFGEARRCERETDFSSHPTLRPVILAIDNHSGEDVRFYWLTPSGGRMFYASLPPGGHIGQQSHEGAYWLVATRDDRCIAIFSAASMAVGIF